MSRMRLIQIIIACGTMMILAGCSPPFPRNLLDEVRKDVTYADLHKAPDQYRGAVVMVGGTIVETKNLKEGTRIEVLQRPLDGEGRPLFTDETGGRFLVIAGDFHDSAVYQRGRSITFIAAVTGQEVHPLGEIDYRYPMLEAKAVHLWAPYAGPRFSVGIGVFKGY